MGALTLFIFFSIDFLSTSGLFCSVCYLNILQVISKESCTYINILYCTFRALRWALGDRFCLLRYRNGVGTYTLPVFSIRTLILKYVTWTILPNFHASSYCLTIIIRSYIDFKLLPITNINSNLYYWRWDVVSPVNVCQDFII